MKRIMTVLLLLFAGLVVGCAGPKVKAPQMGGGGQYTILVLADRGIGPDFESRRADQYGQIGRWMERDLLRMLKSAGYNGRQISSRDQFVAVPGTFLLTLRIVDYNPGSKAARMLVGFGAGTTSLDTHYQLFGTAAEPLLDKEHGVASSIEWTKVVQTLNQRMVDAVSERLRQGER